MAVVERPPSSAERPWRKALIVICAGAFLAAGVLRAFAGLRAPLWLDEAFTGAIALQPDFPSFLRQVLDEGNAPIYYLLMFVWTHLCGTSDLAFRIPSVLLALGATGLAAAAFPRQRRVSLVWAALVGLWVPGIVLSGDARDYTLVYAAAVLQTIALVRLLKSPTLPRAALFVAAASLMVLCHYYACFLAVAEAGVVLARLRGRAASLWPASLAAVPALIWLAIHGPRAVRFAGSGVVWYDRLRLADVPGDLSLLLGGGTMALVCATVLLFARQRARSSPPAQPGSEDLSALLIAAAAAWLAAVVLVLVGVARPFFIPRYLVPEAPGALLGIVVLAERLGGGRAEPLAALVAAYLLVAVGWAVGGGAKENAYSFERASAWVEAAHPDRLVFYWDHPNTPAETPRQLQAVGGFFLTRAGRSLPVIPLYPAPGDMSQAAATAAGPRGAVIWLYDTDVRGTRAAAQSPRMTKAAPGDDCRNFGRDNIGVLACRPKVGDPIRPGAVKGGGST